MAGATAHVVLVVGLLFEGLGVEVGSQGGELVWRFVITTLSE